MKKRLVLTLGKPLMDNKRGFLIVLFVASLGKTKKAQGFP